MPTPELTLLITLVKALDLRNKLRNEWTTMDLHSTFNEEENKAWHLYMSAEEGLEQALDEARQYVDGANG